MEELIIKSINDAIEKKGIMKSHISREAKIPNDRLSRVLDGKLRLRIEEMCSICGVLDISAARILQAAIKKQHGKA